MGCTVLGHVDGDKHRKVLAHAAELEKRLDDEVRLAGDLEAALRLVADELDKPLDPLTRVQLKAYVLNQIKRLRG